MIRNTTLTAPPSTVCITEFAKINSRVRCLFWVVLTMITHHMIRLQARNLLHDLNHLRTIPKTIPILSIVRHGRRRISVMHHRVVSSRQFVFCVVIVKNHCSHGSKIAQGWRCEQRDLCINTRQWILSLLSDTLGSKRIESEPASLTPYNSELEWFENWKSAIWKFTYGFSVLFQSTGFPELEVADKWILSSETFQKNFA